MMPPLAMRQQPLDVGEQPNAKRSDLEGWSHLAVASFDTITAKAEDLTPD